MIATTGMAMAMAIFLIIFYQTLPSKITSLIVVLKFVKSMLFQFVSQSVVFVYYFIDVLIWKNPFQKEKKKGEYITDPTLKVY